MLIYSSGSHVVVSTLKGGVLMDDLSIIEQLAMLFHLELTNSFTIVGNSIHLFMDDGTVIEIKAKKFK